MGQSLIQNYIHIVFSTKNRHPFILESVQKLLFSYIGSICKDLESQPIIVGGHKDHIHILCRLTHKLPLMTLVQKVKANSSRWIKNYGSEFKHFKWQDGYAAFSVDFRKYDGLQKYILNQNEHHKHFSYKEELSGMLLGFDGEIQEKYLWD